MPRTPNNAPREPHLRLLWYFPLLNIAGMRAVERRKERSCRYWNFDPSVLWARNCLRYSLVWRNSNVPSMQSLRTEVIYMAGCANDACYRFWHRDNDYEEEFICIEKQLSFHRLNLLWMSMGRGSRSVWLRVYFRLFVPSATNTCEAQVTKTRGIYWYLAETEMEKFSRYASQFKSRFEVLLRHTDVCISARVSNSIKK